MRHQRCRPGDRQRGCQRYRRAFRASAADPGPHLRGPCHGAGDGRRSRMTDTVSVARPPRPAALAARVTIVTQTRIRSGQEVAFATWQERIGASVARFPGFIEQSVMPPSPPVQVDWVILQRFDSSTDALSWLHSEERLQLVQDAHDILVGNDDIHLLTDDEAGAMPSPVSAIISTRIKPGKEAIYRRWEQRMAAAQARA